MEQNETIEGNRLIAIFCGYREIKGWDGYEYGYTLHPTINVGCTGDMELKYHYSWDCLMPVVEKIASLLPDDFIHFEIGKRYTRCNLWSLETGRTHTFDESKDTLIETVWIAVVKFIKQYNSQPVKPL